MERRPVVVLCVCMMAGITFVYCIESGILPACFPAKFSHDNLIPSIVFAACALLGVITAFYMRLSNRPEKAIIFVLLTVFLFGAARASFLMGKTDEVCNYSDHGEKILICADIINAPARDKLLCRVRYIGAGDIAEDSVEWREKNEVHGLKTLLHLEESSEIEVLDLIGREIVLNGRITAPQPARNPNTFNYAAHLKNKGIGSIIKGAEVVDIGDTIPRYRIFLICENLKNKYIKYLKNAIGDKSAGLVLGMFLGDKSDLDEDVYAMFQKNGSAHILAVSGMHVGILYACLAYALRRQRRIIANSLICFILILYLLLSGIAVSALRAEIMIFFHILARALNQRYDFLTAGGISAILILSVNPLAMFGVDFQFSYLMIFTIGIVLKFFEGFFQKIVIVTAVIQIGALPISMFYFNYLSMATFLVNVPSIFLVGIILPMAIPVFIFSLIGDFVPDFMEVFFCDILNMLCKILTGLNEFVYEPGRSFKYVASPSLFFILLFYGFLFFLCSETAVMMFRRKRLPSIVKVSLMIFVASAILSHVFWVDIKDANAVFVDIGQGDCIHIKTKNGKNILIDTGGSKYRDVGGKVLAPYLLRNGVTRVDLCILSHLDFDHYGGLQNLAKIVPVRRIAMFSGNEYVSRELCEGWGIAWDEVLALSAGDKFRIDGLEFEILYPEGTEAHKGSGSGDGTGFSQGQLQSGITMRNQNSYSLVMRVKGEHYSLILTGDIGRSEEESLRGELKSDILKVAHHGSRYSSGKDFLSAVSPEYAVIQVGKNVYGHPAQETLDRLTAQGITCYRNDVNGAIWFESGKDGIKFESLIN